MELLQRDIKVASRSTIVRIYFLYDWHTGAYGFEPQLLKRHINKIMSEDDSFAVLGGDLGEFIGKKDPRYNPRGVHPMFHEDLKKNNLVGGQYNFIEKTLKPLADAEKILAYVEGNHELKFAHHTDIDFTSMIGERLGVPYGGGCAIIGLRLKRLNATRVCIVNAIHGKRGGATTASKVTCLERQSTRIRGCHIYTRGHGHTKFVLPGERVGIRINQKTGNIEEFAEPEAKASSGAYSRILVAGGQSYAEDGEYQPTDLGCVYAEIKPFHDNGKSDKMRIEIRDLVN
jgi:hypothetical protein